MALPTPHQRVRILIGSWLFGKKKSELFGRSEQPAASEGQFGFLGNWLPESDAHQNQIPLLFEFVFGVLNVRKGEKHILLQDEYLAVCRARIRSPKVSSARTCLELAVEWQKRLKSNPGLTRTGLAREVRIDASRLTQILNLLNLAPEIRRHVLSLPASPKRSPVTERNLRPFARLRDHRAQVLAFNRLLSGIRGG